MKKAAAPILMLVITILAGFKAHTQVNQAMIDSLKKRALQLQQLNNRDLIRRNPDSILKIINGYVKFNDSTIKQIKNQAVKDAPHGDIIQRYLNTNVHTDTVYTTVQLSGTVTVKSKNRNSSVMVSCKSVSAPMVQKGSTFSILLMSKDLLFGGANVNTASLHGSQGKYVASQTNIEGMGFINGATHYQHSEGVYTLIDNSTITSSPDGDKMQFVFALDTLTHIGQVGFLKVLKVHVVHVFDTVGNSGYPQLVTRSEDAGSSAAISAMTDKLTWNMANMSRDAAYSKLDSITDGKLSKIQFNNNGDDDDDKPAPILVINKTSYGYSLTCDYVYNKDGETTVMHITAFIGKPIVQYEAIIKPVVPLRDREANTYKRWLPKGPNVDSSNVDFTDDSMKFYVQVRDKVDTNKVYSNYTVRWLLQDVTHYKGYCTNFPVESANEKADLRFADTVKHDVHYDGAVNDSVAITQKGQGEGRVVTVSCNDYGAWGKLQAIVTMEYDQSELTAYPFYDKSMPYITIPYDKDENKIADQWETDKDIANRHYSVNWDEDKTPDNGHNGDNIPLIDEYRGFAAENSEYKRVHTRLEPTVKELFTVAEKAYEAGTNSEYKADVRLGVKNWTRATGVLTYHLTHSEYAKKEDNAAGAKFGRWINYNSPLENTKTHAVVLYAEDIFDHKAYASCIPLVANTRGAQPPGETNYVAFWLKGVWLYDGPPKPDPTNAAVSIPDDYTVAALHWFRPNPASLSWNKVVNRHVEHAKALFNVEIDTLTIGNIVQSSFAARMHQFMTYNVAHELCHATNIAHHGNDDGHGSGDAFYKGDAHCPMRYFLTMDNENDFPNCADWAIMFETNKWDVSKGIGPDGADLKICRSGVNCFSQMRLK